ncbi:MAG: hypothetical protein H6739_00565 [Alphaproteobacteria bacterium]|nr:hypothetical protein [Alphaproteobacteria bacterium]
MEVALAVVAWIVVDQVRRRRRVKPGPPDGVAQRWTLYAQEADLEHRHTPVRGLIERHVISGWVTHHWLTVDLEASMPFPGPVDVVARVAAPPGLPEGFRLWRADVEPWDLNRLGTMPMPEAIALDYVGDARDRDRASALLEDPGVQELLRLLRDDDVGVDADGVYARPAMTSADDPARLIARLCALADALGVLALGPWQRVGRDLGLEVREVPPGLRGEVEGAQVEVTYQDTSRAEESVLVVHLPRALPGGLRLYPKGRGAADRADARPVHVANPVLDLYIDAFALEPERCDRLLEDPELTAPMLEVLHEHPGARVSGDRVVIRTKGLWVEGLAPAIRASVALARRLSAGVEP